MWYIIYYICEDGTEMEIHTKFYPFAGSDNGINGGRISKLMIRLSDFNKDLSERKSYILLNYDRGWDIEPDPNNKNLMEAYNYVLTEHNYYNPFIRENDWRWNYVDEE